MNTHFHLLFTVDVVESVCRLKISSNINRLEKGPKYSYQRDVLQVRQTKMSILLGDIVIHIITAIQLYGE